MPSVSVKFEKSVYDPLDFQVANPLTWARHKLSIDFCEGFSWFKSFILTDEGSYYSCY